MTHLARRTDPSTSKAAGEAAECDSLTHVLVWCVLGKRGKTDDWIVRAVQKCNNGRPSPQRIRCARKELADAGKIELAGKVRLASGKYGRTWRIK